MKTIKVTQEVHDMLSEISSKKDTYNDIILRLIKEHDEKNLTVNLIKDNKNVEK